MRADIPAGARKARLTFRATLSALAASGTMSFTGISARLIGRPSPGSPLELLSAVDGPLTGNGDTVSYAYDTLGNVSQVTDEVGLVTSMTAHNLAGQPLTIVDPNNVSTDLTYDQRGRLETITVDPGPNEAVTEIDYDLAGNVLKITKPDGNYLQYTYNDASRVTLIANNASETIELSYDALGNVTERKTKSAAGTIVAQQSQVFDEIGRLLQSFGAASQTTSFGYDRTDLRTAVTDPRSNLYSFAYDALARLIRDGPGWSPGQLRTKCAGRGDDLFGSAQSRNLLYEERLW
jgi:YD repeat-containing protein